MRPNKIQRSLHGLTILGTLMGLLSISAYAGQSENGDLVMTKTLIGASGVVNSTGNNYSVSSACGESMSGYALTQGDELVLSGYFGGRFGNSSSFQITATKIGNPSSKTFFQDGIQVGVPLQAPVEVDFSDPIDSQTVNSALNATLLGDHLGNSTDTPCPLSWSLDTTGSILTITPSSSWQANSLYQLTVSELISSLDGFNLNSPTNVSFATLLDPQEDNWVLHPLAGASATAGTGQSTTTAPLNVNIHIPPEALSNFSVLLLSQDPLNAPLSVDPQIIKDANAKALAANGTYATPVSIQEINAYDQTGNLINKLSAPAQISVAYSTVQGLVNTTPQIIRPNTLALWTLDQEHHLWVKIPESQISGQTVTASVTGLSVFAVMGSPDDITSDVFVFPTPWRPHGPNAGTGPGQTGSLADGMTFSNLPSECTIKIYTLSGNLVRQLEHSDTSGTIAQEKWDGNTSGGDSAASGVYLWRVESSGDAKNGKLMIIR